MLKEARKEANMTQEELHLNEVRKEIIYQLDMEGYNGSQIALIFNLPRSTTHEIIKRKPEGWTSPWSKVR